MVRPVDDPSALCMESETVDLLREVYRCGEAGDVEWLRQHGRVYAAVDEAA